MPDDPMRLTADSAFSYACHRCGRCCHDKLIQVNPYEIARLARHRGLGTTEFIATHLDALPHLRRQEDGACVFFGPEGCTVHADRPLVCRIYPLGSRMPGDGTVEYHQFAGHPESAGVFGKDGTIAAYLAQQQAEDFLRAAARYRAVLQRIYDAWRASPPPPGSADDEESAAADGDPAPDLLDLDRAVAEECARRQIPEPTDLEERMALHLAAIEQWLARQSESVSAKEEAETRREKAQSSGTG